MYHVHIIPHLSIEAPGHRSLGARVLELLLHVEQCGSLAAACTAMNLSYRHAWQLLQDGQALFGQPLLHMARGKGATLTPLGERLAWAQRRMQARLSPLLASLASELGAELEKLTQPPAAHLRLHASHGFSVQALSESMARDGLAHDLRYCGSVEALEALANGQCDIAGFHVPIGGPYEKQALAHYRPWLDARRYRVIRLTMRRQGLMTRPGNPCQIHDVPDLAKPGVRFVNRQAGSGTRFLLDLMLRQHGIASSAVAGYEQCEYTHAAVAAFVASGMADAGMGVELPARQFGLDFIPLQLERYMLLCEASRIDTPAVQHMLSLLQSPAYLHAISQLPGYATDHPGRVQPLHECLPALAETTGSAPKGI